MVTADRAIRVRMRSRFPARQALLLMAMAQYRYRRGIVGVTRPSPMEAGEESQMISQPGREGRPAEAAQQQPASRGDRTSRRERLALVPVIFGPADRRLRLAAERATLSAGRYGAGCHWPAPRPWVRLSRGAVRQSVLAAEFDLAPRTITDVIDALERDGLAERQADPTDR